MILNDNQRRVTEEQLEKFERALAALRATPQEGIHPLFRKAQEDALLSQIEEFEWDLKEYEERQK